jgi:hypothetical protein
MESWTSSRETPSSRVRFGIWPRTAAAWAALAPAAYVPEADERVVVLLCAANTSIEL